MTRFSSLLALAALAPAVRACIEAHVYFQGSFITDDLMTMQVWVNQELVCSYTDDIYLSSDTSVFCARNSDGEGTGCAAGYTFCVHDYGKTAVFSYYENNEVAWTTQMSTYDYETGSVPDCLCWEDEDGETCFDCPTHESVLTTADQACDNLVQPELCDGKAQCEKEGLSDNPDDIVNLHPFPYLPFKLMVVGDSISHGMESDWTWRYRLWEWLNTLGYDVQFVGPYSGTHGPAPPSEALPSPPLLPGETAAADPAVIGLYASGVSPDFASTGHGAWWGRQAAQVKETINGWVEEYQPDYVLVMLGFNDLGWFVSGPDGLISSMNELVSWTREAKSDVNILVANVVQRLFIDGRQDLVDNTNTYNEDLKTAVSIWQEVISSPISYVDVASNYQCGPGACSDGYDGLHPAAIGEYHIAQAFANVLRDDFGMKGQDFSVPTPPSRDISTPSGFTVQAVPEGIFSGWTEVENARGYNIRMRIEGMTDWWSDGAVYPNTFASYFTWCLAGQTWEVAVQTHGDFDQTSDWTSIQSATCNPQTSQGPPNIVVQPSGSDSITFTWGAVSGFSVNRYEVIVWDQDVEGSFINGFSTTGTSYTVTGLTAGHNYGTWVATWVNLADGNNAGGLPSAAHNVIVGGGAPSQPSGLSVSNTDPTTVHLTWTGSSGSVAGYGIYYKSLLNASDTGLDGTTTSTSWDIGFLFPGTWHYSFCVTAFNGNLESACTAWVTPEVYPGYTKRTELETNGTTHGAFTAEQSSTAQVYDSQIQKLWKLKMENATAALPQAEEQ